MTDIFKIVNINVHKCLLLSAPLKRLFSVCLIGHVITYTRNKNVYLVFVERKDNLMAVGQIDGYPCIIATIFILCLQWSILFYYVFVLSAVVSLIILWWVGFLNMFSLMVYKILIYSSNHKHIR